MKIAILGNGGREHAIAVQLSKSSKLKKIYCIPGNAGTSFVAENVDLDINNFDLIYQDNSEEIDNFFIKAISRLKNENN